MFHSDDVVLVRIRIDKMILITEHFFKSDSPDFDKGESEIEKVYLIKQQVLIYVFVIRC